MSIAYRFLAPSLVAVAIASAACTASTAADDDAALGAGGATGSAATAQPASAPIGIPSAPAMGERKFTSRGQILAITGRKDPTGAALPDLEYRVSPAGANTSIEGDKFGPALEPIPGQGAGWQTSATGKWACVKAQEFALGKATLTDATQKCHVEVNPTGDQGFSITLIGLDSKGQGITAYTSPAGARVFAAGLSAVVSIGPIKSVNVNLDEAAVLQAMKDVKARFSTVPNTARNDCLKNARASGWLDIQAHYYCLLPYATVRNCYSRKLIESASSIDASVRAKAAAIAYETCFDPKNKPSTDAAWIHANQQAVFKYIMFTKQGVVDFNVDSENKVINGYYSFIKESRPRRANDTYPTWLPNQPRYDRIRELQFTAQQQAASTASGGGT